MKFAPLALLAFLSSPLAAQTPYVVHDINTRPSPTRASPDLLEAGNGLDGDHAEAFGAFLMFDGGYLFTARSVSSGNEPWMAKAGQSVLLADPAAVTADADPNWLAVLGNQALFVATNAAGDREQNGTDGTPEGTGLLADLHPLGVGDPQGLTALPVAGLVVFSAKSANRRELWVTGGTAAGEQLAFSGFANQGPRTLHLTDGTAKGTLEFGTLRPAWV